MISRRARRGGDDGAVRPHAAQQLPVVGVQRARGLARRRGLGEEQRAGAAQRTGEGAAGGLRHGREPALVLLGAGLARGAADDADPVQLGGLPGEQVHRTPVGQPFGEHPAHLLHALVQVRGVAQGGPGVGQQGEPLQRGHAHSGSAGVRGGRQGGAVRLLRCRGPGPAGRAGRGDRRGGPGGELGDEHGAAVGHLLGLDEQPDGYQPSVAVQRGERYRAAQDPGLPAEQQGRERSEVAFAQVLRDEGGEGQPDEVVGVPSEQVRRRSVRRDDRVPLVGGDRRNPAGMHLAGVPGHQLGRARAGLAGHHRPRGGCSARELADDLVEQPLVEDAAARQRRQGQEPFVPGLLLGQVEDRAQRLHGGPGVRRHGQGQGPDLRSARLLLERGRHTRADQVVHVLGGGEFPRWHAQVLSGGQGEEDLAQQRVPVLLGGRVERSRYVHQCHGRTGGGVRRRRCRDPPPDRRT